MFTEYKAWYRSAWGRQPRQLVTITGISTHKGRIALDYITESGEEKWGYVNQFDAYEGERQ